MASASVTEQKKATGSRIAEAGIEWRAKAAPAGPEFAFVDVAQGDEREYEQHSGVGVPGPPQVLA